MMRTFTAIVNPIAGGGSAAQRWTEVASLLRQAGHSTESIESESRTHATEAAARVAAAGRIVVAVGGDGTVRDIVTGIAETGATLAIVPSGRGNDLVHVLNIPSEPHQLATLLGEGSTTPIDLIQLDDLFVPGNVYVGLDGRSTEVINRLRWVPPLFLYRIAPFLATVGWRRFTATITTTSQVDGVSRTASKSLRTHMVMVANSGRYGHGLNMVPNASPGDGALDVFVVHGVHVLRLVSLTSHVTRGTHLSRPDISTWPATTVSISADRQLPVYADGEKIGRLPCQVSIRPGMLQVIAPGGSISH